MALFVLTGIPTPGHFPRYMEVRGSLIDTSPRNNAALGVVDESVDQGGGDQDVAEDFAPGVEAAV
jgi:hypothetical protein